MRLPSFSTGFAKTKGESLYPDLWDGLVGLWSPEMGKQGDRLYDWSGRAHHGTLNSMDASTDYIGGKYGYALNFDGSNDNITTNNIPEINTVSQTMTVMFWVRTTANSNNCILSYDNNDSLSPSSDWYIYTPANLTYGGFCDSNERASGVAINDGKWHHCCIVARQTSTEFWMDGILRSSATGLTHKSSPGSDYTTSHTFRFADNSNVSHFPGDLGEVRLYNRDLTGSQIRRSYLGQSPLEASPIYLSTFNGDQTINPNVLNVTSEVLAPSIVIDCTVSPSVLDVTSEVLAPNVGNIETFNPNVLDALSELLAPSVRIDCTVTPSVLDAVSDILSPTFPGLNGASFGSRILSINPLLFVTNTAPAKLVKVDTTDPENPTWETVVVSDIDYAVDASIDELNELIYIGGNDGKIVKVDINDLNSQTLIDVEDNDEIITMSHYQNYGITFAGTDNNIGELYIIDERETEIIDSRLDVLVNLSVYGDLTFNAIEAQYFESDIQVLAYVKTVINCDFKCLTAEIDNIDPIKRTDFHVYLDGIELGNTDIDLSSIIINHNIGEKSTARFILSRKHDKLNTDLDNNIRQITNQNEIEIYIQDHLEFTGRISRLDCNYSENTDHVTVEVTGNERDYRFNFVNLSLPGLTERLSIYHVMIHNPQIYNPYIDPDDENPIRYKGIIVNLGQKRVESVSRFHEFDSLGTDAEAIQNGTFIPRQNWTYFWSPTVTRFGNYQINSNVRTPPTGIPFHSFTLPSFNLPVLRISATNSPFLNLGETSAQFFAYIGTSLAPVSEDLWILTNANHRRQREFDDIITELGTYTVGSEPFKQISVRNNIFKPSFRWEDKSNGLYSVRKAGYNFLDYAKRVADLEYQKLLNINGEIFPETSCNLSLMIDGYYYHDLQLLTRINIDNTTETGIYHNNNGFPVSIKGITIDSSTMKVTLNTDNLKSQIELEAIDGQFPDEDDPEFNDPEQNILIALKSDMKTSLKVE